ncbi:ATP-binding cassette sub-family G member 3-like isoform X1 [Sigmodon hispidus]
MNSCIRKEEPLEISSNNDPVANTMIERNSNDLPIMDTSGEAVLSFHNISYQEMVQIGSPFHKITWVIERLSNIKLLDILAARKDPGGLSGNILINGKPRPPNFKCTSGYVPQDDMVMSTVTVRDNIEFSAALRLPMTISRDERRRRVDEVLELLHLNEESNAKPRFKDLKKRTSIAMELVVEHPILFLDDPTSGLDLRTIIDIIFILKRMSMRGRTIIFSINQPQYSIFRCFDSLTLLSSGKVMFHGPTQEALRYFTSAGYKCDSHNNLADFFLDIIHGGFSAILDTEEDNHDADQYKELSERQYQVTAELANMYMQSDVYSDLRTELDLLLGEQEAGRSSALEEVTCVTPFCHQFRWIIYRSFKIFIGFPRKIVFQAIVAVILAMIMGTTFYFLQNDCSAAQIRASLLFFLTVFQCIRSVSTGELFMTDRDRFLHEHSSGYYSVSSYFFGKLLAVFVPKRVLLSIIFTVIVFSIAESLISEHSWIQYINILHYGFTALLHNEFLGQNLCPEHKRAEISRCQNFVICTGEEFLTAQGMDLSSWGFWKNHVALTCTMIIFLSIAYLQFLPLKKKRLLLCKMDKC